MKNFETLMIGAAGSVMSAASGSISPEDISNAVQVIVQILIGIATLYGIFKKKKVN